MANPAIKIKASLLIRVRNCRLVLVLASEFEFAIALREDLKVAAGEPIGRVNIADGRVQPHRVVMGNEATEA